MSPAAAVQIPLEKTIVLIVPAKGMDDAAGLRASLAAPGRGARVLLCIPKGADQSLAASVATRWRQWAQTRKFLLHAQAPELSTGAFELHAPADMSHDDQIEFALALFDVVLKIERFRTTASAAAQSLQSRSFGSASRFLAFSRAAASPRASTPSGPAGFQTDNRCWDASSRRLSRYSLSDACGWNKEGRTESTKRLKQCFPQGVESPSLFRSGEWQASHRIEPRSWTQPRDRHPFLTQWTGGAVWVLHPPRSDFWATHFAAAFAVFAAVAGLLWKSWSWFWGRHRVRRLLSAEPDFRLAPLLAAGPLTAYRLGATAGIARMSLPLGVAIGAQQRTRPASVQPRQQGNRIGALALEEVKRAVRDQGLPVLRCPSRHRGRSLAGMRARRPDQLLLVGATTENSNTLKAWSVCDGLLLSHRAPCRGLHPFTHWEIGC